MSGYEIRRYDEADEPAVLELMRRSLGWKVGDPNAELFRWKHVDNPFGASPAWVAIDDDAVVGFRAFLRWEFLDSGRVVEAVRAVDTATDPDHQGRGIFRVLTLHALEELSRTDVRFVFNTPNDQSRPGYLKMGWQEAGRVPVSVRPRSVQSLGRMARSRVPSELWSTPTDAGVPASSALAEPGLGELLTRLPSSDFGTHRTADYLRWRFGLPALHYRALPIADDIADGLVLFRLRKRGSTVEAAVCDVLVPKGVPRRFGRELLRATRADYAIGTGRQRGFLPLPRQGPLLTFRSVGDGAQTQAFDPDGMSLGDVELF